MADEYINKADAIKTLMQMQWHDEEGSMVEDEDERRQYAEDWVNCMPTIDIVHCKECIHENFGICSHIDHKWERHEADYFCADGEREVTE